MTDVEPIAARTFPVRALNLVPLRGVAMRAITVPELEYALARHGRAAVLERWDVPADLLPTEET